MLQEKMNEIMTEMNEVKGIKSTLLSWLKEEVNTGKDCCHLESTGDVSDIIKDLAQTEKECAEALYYMVVIFSMLQEGNSSEDIMGYNHRHMSNGQFASARKGYTIYDHQHKPYVDQEPYIDAYLHDPNFKQNMMAMGYGDGTNSRRDNGMNRNSSGSKYGKSYDDYQTARRHYTASKNLADKEEMDQHAMAHVGNVLESLQELWESSDDVMLKKEIVEEMSKALNEMKATQK